MAKQPLAEPLAVVAGLRTPFVRAGGPLDRVAAESLLGGVLSELLERSLLAEGQLELLVLSLAAEDALEVDAREVLRRSVCSADIAVRQYLPGAPDDLQALDSLVEAMQGGGVGVGALLGARLHRRGAPERLWWRLWNSLRGMRDGLRRARGESGAGFEFREALKSYGLAARAWGEGRFEDQVMSVLIAGAGEVIAEDELRRHFHAETLRSYGVAGLVLATADQVQSLALRPLGWIRAMASERVPVGDTALSNFALDVLAGSEPCLVELSESTRSAEALRRGLLSSGAEWLEMADRLNVTGDSVAFGDAGCATFPRQVVQLLHELGRRGGGVGLCLSVGEVSTALALEVPRG
ncbi:MAG: hypothetical protein H6718_24540 [Polyangiaceae bacterium]|nr:hypothetical protein [Myxococcales bacterium]MCB9588601.1 hypothetical protein [Polyangiaceae bacterium]